MPFEQGLARAEFVEHFVFGHLGLLSRPWQIPAVLAGWGFFS
jgi:hypothetical protein